MRWVLLLAAAAAVPGCNAIFGVDELRFDAAGAATGSPSTGTGGGAGAGAGTGATAGTGGAPTGTTSSSSSAGLAGGSGGTGGSGSGLGGGGVTLDCSTGPVLEDDFGEVALSNIWDAYGNGSVSISAGELLIQSDMAAGTTGVRSVDRLDFTGCRLLLTVAEGSPSPDVGYADLLLSAAESLYFGYVFEEGWIRAVVVNGGTITDPVEVYDPGQPVWLQVLESGGMLTFASSLDGSGWTSHLTTAAPAYATSVEVNLRVRNTGAPAATSTLRVDEVSVAP